VALHGALHVSGTKLLDSHDSAVQLKGPSSMWLNWESTGYAKDPAGVAFLRDDWKATVIRAAMGVEPAGAYLSDPNGANQAVRDVIDNAINLGMYVIVDWHDHNAQLHQPEAIQFFQQIAREYGQLPNILYELFNEPLQVSWESTVKPYHEAVIQAIREIDPDNVIILGSPQWDQDLKAPAANPVLGTNLMYALHFYSCSHGQQLRDAGDVALAQNLALFVTEWGATNADGGTADNPALCLDEAQAFIDWMNQNQISWTAWKLDDCTDKTCYFVARTPTVGNWTDSQLNGHALFVRDRMRE
jgi:endoglucanase